MYRNHKHSSTQISKFHRKTMELQQQDCIPKYDKLDTLDFPSVLNHRSEQTVLFKQHDTQSVTGNTASERVKRAIDKRVEELKRFAEEDNDICPRPDSEEALYKFLSLFPPATLPELTFGDDGCYYLRVVKGGEKLVLIFLPEASIHYLIDTGTHHLENICPMDFFTQVFCGFVKELFSNV